VIVTIGAAGALLALALAIMALACALDETRARIWN
jgi:hypothetical protein